MKSPAVGPAGRLGRLAVLGIALGSLGAGVFSTVPTVLLLFYCTEILGVSPAIAAAIVFIPKAWAIVWDPLVGVWSDRSRSASGRRAPFILAGALGVAVTFALLFNAPAMGGNATIAYVMLIFFAMATVYSVFAVPYVSIPAEISPLAVERERLLVWRMSLAMLGVLVGAGIAPHLVVLAGGGRRGYGVMAIEVAAICGLAMLTTYFTVRRHHVKDRPEEASGFNLKDDLRQVLRDREYVRLWVAYLLAMCGFAMFMALVPYFVTHVLGRNEGDAGTALFALLIGTIVTMPLWSKAMRRWGGWPAFLASVIAYLFIAAAFVFVPHALPFERVVPLFFLLGVPFAGFQLLPFTLLAHIAHASAESGVRKEGLYTGLWTAGEKLALAIGPASAGAGLAFSGYVSGAAEQSAQALMGLQWAMSLGPALFLLPCLVLLVLRVARTPAQTPAST